MKKRLRKKLHLGEFTKWGFEVSFKSNIPIDQAENVLDDFLTFCDENRLMIGGSFGDSGAFYVTTYKHECNIWTQEIVKTWFMNYKKFEITDVKCSELEDCFHLGKYKIGWPKPIRKLKVKPRTMGPSILSYYPNFKLPE